MKILIAILVFSVIIIVHEMGHFLLAKKNNVLVTEFSVGMGPRILSVKRGETRYSLKLVPFGGSCMMPGEDEDSGDERGFDKQSVWARISIIAAGPIFNFIFAFIIALIFVGMVGYDPATVTKVTDGSPAQEAGLLEGDSITKINGYGVDISSDLSFYLQIHPLTASEVDVQYERDGKKYSTTLQPEIVDTYMLGFGYTADNNPTIITLGDVYQDYPLAIAGLQDGDIITAVNGNPVATGKELNNYMSENPLTAEDILVTYTRDGVENTVSVTPKLVDSSYSMGMAVNAGYVKTDVLGVIKYSYVQVKYMIKTTFQSLGMLFTGQLSKDDLAGPVGLVDAISTTVESAQQYGARVIFLNICNWIIIISANLGVMNLLPLPALDGGRLVFLFIEVLRGGKAIPKEKEGMVHMIGLVALMILMVFIMFNDISRLFA